MRLNKSSLPLVGTGYIGDPLWIAELLDGRPVAFNIYDEIDSTRFDEGDYGFNFVCVHE
jgi:hypothetical protein